MEQLRDDFNFKIINFPNMCSNIPASPAYGVYISQLIRYARASSNYSDFLKGHLHLRNRLLDQGYKKIRLIRTPNNLTKGKSKLISILTDKISQQPENCENRNDPDLVQAFLKKWWVESDFKATNLPLSLWLKVSSCHYDSIYSNA
jgi:hypothetical protein